MSWEDCQEFVIKLNELTGLNFRLPTEAEWEYAACGGCLRQPTQYAGGNEIDPLAWYSGNVPTQGTQPVGTKAPNELGIHDMNGNVWEWCKDWSDGFDHYVPFSSYGMPSGTHRLRRGGCWSSSEANCGVMTYGSSLPSEKNNRLGLRLVLGGKENCPEVSFDIEEELMLSLGESKSVGIQYGCGRYDVSTSDGITCTISGEKVIVTGTSTGSTSFLLVDLYTGKKIKLDVYVIGKNSTGTAKVKDFSVKKGNTDSVKISGGTVKSIGVSGSDVIVKGGKSAALTLQNAKNKTFTVTDTLGNYTVSGSNVKLTLGKNYKGTLTAASFITTVDAKSNANGITIKGNKKNTKRFR